MLSPYSQAFALQTWTKSMNDDYLNAQQNQMNQVRVRAGFSVRPGFRVSVKVSVRVEVRVRVRVRYMHASPHLNP